MFVDDTLVLGYATIDETAQFKLILDRYEAWSGQLVNAQKSTLLFSPNVNRTTRVAISEMLGMTEVSIHGKYLGLPTTIGSSKKEQKNEGGLGFRVTQSFNRRYVNKFGRSSQSPTVLFLGSLKIGISHHLHSGILNWDQKPSYTWHSILSVRDLICKGIQWKLASGSDIRVWGHKWVSHTHSNMLITPVHKEFKDITVADLIDSEIGVWKISFLPALLYPIDSEAILQHPLSNLEGRDQLLWAEIKKDNLLKRHAQISSSCALCGHITEGLLHLMTDCSYMQELNTHLQMHTVQSGEVAYRFRLWLVCMWDLWYQRNCKIHAKPFRSPN
ncbi:hypothetical protein LIER_15077 [Lithospermum erythrorhizon]|uniref:Reverse transcriptase zinc-binding domain-containing protein n=1 Tax=Lithospermum erythrorhizon TaxID=34254 RepID=A0AAV3Q401_LITER